MQLGFSADMGELLKTTTRRPRSADGCIGCRLRKKKCSLERPHCANCGRNNILCTWPEIGNEQHARLLRRTNPRGQRHQSPTRSRSGIHVAAAAGAAGQQQQQQQQQQPESQHDSARGASYDRRDAVPQRPMVLSPGVLPGNSVLRRSTSRRLFDHYLHRTNKAIAICRDDKRNPFIAELVPLALSHASVLDAVLACSGIHLADGVMTSVDSITWVHYGQAIQAQKFGLTQLARGRTEMLVPLFVTALILCTVECFKNGSGSSAVHHLKAARALLREGLRQPESQLGTQLADFLLERYAYTIALAHITMGPESDEWVLDDTTYLFETMRRTSLPTRLGCVHELFEFIPRVSVAARRRREALTAQACDGNPGGGRADERGGDFASLSHAISSWTPRPDDETHSLCGRVYQQALLLYLESANPAAAAAYDDEDSGSCDVVIQEAFDRFTPLINSIPAESPVSTSLCWPLAIFGSCARTANQRGFIQGKLESLAQRYAAPSVNDVKGLLEKLWAEDAAARGGGGLPASPQSFESLMRREEMTVLFL